MSFLHPGILAAGLAAIAIPIVIHFLMRRRRRPIQWAAMRFLLEAWRKQRRRLRLEQIILLAARCLLIALIGFALARPLLGGDAGAGSGPTTLYLLIDTGIASGAESEGSTALERHQALASDLLGSLSESRGDRGAVIALGAPADPRVVPPSPDLGAVAQVVRSLEPTDAANDLPGAVERLRTELDSEDESARRDTVRVVLLSDMLAGSAETAQPIGSPGERPISFAATPPRERGLDNTTVIRVSPRREVVVSGRGGAVGTEQVRVGLRRTGPGVGAAAATKVRLSLETPRGTTPLGERVLRWEPGQTEAKIDVPVDLSGVPAGSGAVLVAQIDRDALDADNTARHAITLREQLRVGVVGPRRFGARPPVDRFDNGDWVRLALAPSEAPGRGDEIDLVDIDPGSVDAPRLNGLDAVVVATPEQLDADAWAHLRTFADGGGLVVVVPPGNVNVHLWPDAMTEAMGLGWNVSREVFEPDKPLSVADVSGHALLSQLAGELAELTGPVSVARVLHVEAPGEAVVLTLSDGSPLVLASPPGTGGETGRGRVVLLACALDLGWTDLPAKPLVVPLLQEIVRQGVGGASWTSVAGAPAPAPPHTARLDPFGGGASERVGGEGLTEHPMRRAGAWRAVDAGGATRGTLVVAPDTEASRTDAVPRDDVAAWLAPLGEVEWLGESSERTGDGVVFAGTDADKRSPASLPLLLAAAALALFEAAFARFASHARGEGGRA